MIGLLFSVALAEVPGVPPPPYLDGDSVREALDAAPSSVTPCVPTDAEAGLVRARVSLHASGRVEVLSVSGAPGVPTCWTDGLEGLSGPRHAGAPVSAVFGLPYAAGSVGTAVEVRMRTPTPDPIFLHVPADLSEVQLREIRIALGLEAPPD